MILYDAEERNFEENWVICWLSSLPDPLWSEEVVPVRVSFKHKIELFENYLF